MASTEVRAYVRGILRAVMNEGTDQNIFMTTGGELIIAQGLPSETELARQGNGWAVIGSAVTAVAAIPTTAAHLSLYNGNPVKSLVIAAVGSFGTTTVAAAANFSVFARNDVPGANANPAGALIITGLSGKQYPVGANSFGANAKASVALAAIGAGNNVAWMPVGPSVTTPNTTTVGIAVHAECYGRWIVQPGGIFSLATVAQTAAGTMQPYLYFYEVNLPLG